MLYFTQLTQTTPDNYIVQHPIKETKHEEH